MLTKFCFKSTLKVKNISINLDNFNFIHYLTNIKIQLSSLLLVTYTFCHLNTLHSAVIHLNLDRG